MDQFLQAVTTIAGVFFFGLLIAFTIERLVEKLATWPLERAGWPSELKAYIAWVVGGAFSGAFAIDLFTPIALSVGLDPFVPWAGYALTAIAVGGGSQILHDAFGRYLEPESGGNISFQTTASRGADSRTRVSVSSQQDAEK